MSSGVVPKEKMSAYQRWEMASFSAPHAAPEPDAQAHAGIEQLAAIRAAARDKGQQEGYAAGLAAGHSDGLAQGRAAAEQERQHLQQLATSFGHELAHADEAIARQTLELALDLAKAMLKTALPARPQLLLPIVTEAIHYLPSLQQPALLHLQPDDAALVKAQIGDELAKAGWRVVDDAQMERGGCRVETASNQIDASIETRWQRLAAALGSESAWLQP